jgi:trigger factor
MIEFYRSYPAATDALRGPIFEDKVIDYVLDSATVTDAEISVEELEKDPEEPKAAAPAETQAIEAPDETPATEASAPAAEPADGGGSEPTAA